MISPGKEVGRSESLVEICEEFENFLFVEKDFGELSGVKDIFRRVSKER
jgi:hypothetical protein